MKKREKEEKIEEGLGGEEVGVWNLGVGNRKGHSPFLHRPNRCIVVVVSI